MLTRFHKFHFVKIEVWVSYGKNLQILFFLLKLYKYIIFNILLYIISLHAKDHLPPLVRLVSKYESPIKICNIVYLKSQTYNACQCNEKNSIFHK